MSPTNLNYSILSLLHCSCVARYFDFERSPAYQLLKEKHRKKLLMEKVSRNKMKKVLHKKQEKYDRTADYNIHSIKWTEEDLMNKIKIARNMYASCFNGNSCHVR